MTYYRITIDINIDPKDKEKYLNLLNRVSAELCDIVEFYSWEFTDGEYSTTPTVEEIS